MKNRIRTPEGDMPSSSSSAAHTRMFLKGWRKKRDHIIRICPQKDDVDDENNDNDDKII